MLVLLLKKIWVYLRSGLLKKSLFETFRRKLRIMVQPSLFCIGFRFFLMDFPFSRPLSMVTSPNFPSNVIFLTISSVIKWIIFLVFLQLTLPYREVFSAFNFVHVENCITLIFLIFMYCVRTILGTFERMVTFSITTSLWMFFLS